MTDKFALFDRINTEEKGTGPMMGLAAAAAAARYMFPSGWEAFQERPTMTVTRSLSYPADPQKKAQRKRQKKARALNRKGRK